MMKILLPILFITCLLQVSTAQTTILDFETPSTSTVFQYFGSSIDGSFTNLIANPNPSGINLSDSVMEFTKPAVAQVWAGAFSNPNPEVTVDLIANGRVSINVHMDHIGSVTLKLEGSTDGGDNWAVTIPNTQINTWETLVFDVSQLSFEAPFTAAIGHTYERIVLFVDFGTEGTGEDVTSYIDDIVALPPTVVGTTILDFETPSTSTVFQYFGSSIDGSFTNLITNPNPTGNNLSDTVMEFIKPAVAQVWAGAFSNPNPEVAVDLIANDKVSINVHMDHIGSVTLKLEASTDGGDNWAVTVPNTQINTWETLVFDVSQLSIEAPFTAAIGHTYERIVLFVDFGTEGTGEDVISYIDDIVTLPPDVVETIILDFEAPETSTGFQYFGSGLDGTFTQLIANPNPSGINVSDTVTEYIKPAVAQVWAGAFSNPNPMTPITLDVGSQVCIKVHMDHVGNLALKLEQGVSGQPNWVTLVENTVVGEWTEICFDPTIPSFEAPFQPASGTFNRIVLFFDFGFEGTGEDVVSYFDDIVVKSSGAPQPRMVSFKVDMNQYADNFDQVYLSGTFNNWSGDATPLEDPDFDGIWEGTIMVLNGAYEYKVTLDNWLAQEAFSGYEECTKVDPSGQFVNRLLSVSGDTELPQFCYNSCYGCGEEVNITFRVGMGDVPPSPDGVWLVGGGNFDVPGGKYKMSDDDGDEVYEIVVPRKMGFSSFYAFANGACPDFSCKENLSGLPCGDPDNFNDRFLEPVENDYEVATCYGACYTNTECTTATSPIEKDDQVFNLFGNPVAQGYALLDFGSDDLTDKIITVSNSLGQVVEHIVVKNSNSFMLQTNAWPVGMYFITVKVDNRFYTRKLVK